jgi:hypothetical protein
MGHEMSVWPLQVLSSRMAGSRVEAVRLPKNAPLRPPFWLLLACIIVVGIGIGLFATSILLSGSSAQAADSAEGAVLLHTPTPLTSADGLHLHNIIQLWGVDHRDIHQGGRYHEF